MFNLTLTVALLIAGGGGGGAVQLSDNTQLSRFSRDDVTPPRGARRGKLTAGVDRTTPPHPHHRHINIG